MRVTGAGTPIAVALIVALLGASGALLACGGEGEAPAAEGPRVVLVGLDGADWRIIDRLRRQDELPSFDRLIREGARGELETLRPTLSPLIWTSIATGMRPAQHGVANFFTSADRVRVKRIWQIAQASGVASGVQSYMVTWPPDPTLAFSIPGWLAQDDATHPPELSFVKRLDRWLDAGEEAPAISSLIADLSTAISHGAGRESVGGILAAVALEGAGEDAREVEIRKRLASLSLETDVFCKLLRERRPELAVIYNHHIDAVGHLYFKYYQSSHFPDVDPEDALRFGDALPRMYEAVDAALGRIRACSGPNAQLIVVSDHGQRASFAESSPQLRIRYLRLLEGLGLQDDFKATRTGRGVQLRATHAGVDLERAAELLRSVTLQPIGRPFYRVVPRKEGLLLRPGSYYSADHEVALGDGRVPMRELVDVGDRVSGQHTKRALLLMHGPGIAADTELPLGHVLDIAPTVLGLLGLPIGRDMEGRFIAEALDGQASADLELSWVDSHGAAPTYREARPENLTPEALERLRALGYVE
jgi:predicted AlkP superfamily phosphohydrolase/phosphomutase